MRAFLLAALFCFSAFAQSVLPIAPLTARVIDQTATLTTEELSALTSQLKKIEDERGAQVVVLIVASTQPEDIFSYSQRVANAWKIGRKDVGDGVLIVVAKDDRKLRIAIAKSLEGAIPDVLAGHIVREVITPQFKQADYAGGLRDGVAHISARIAGENLPLPAQQHSTGAAASGGQNFGFDPLELLLFAVFAIPVIGGIARQILGNKLGTVAVGLGSGSLAWLLTTSAFIAGGAGVLAIVITLLTSLKNMGLPARSGGGWTPNLGSGGFSSGGYSGGSGGGFSSGGGGDFGGGGASGDW